MNDESSSFAPAHLVGAMDREIGEAEAATTALQSADEGAFSGRYIGYQGRLVKNFVCCSYLGLEQRDELKNAAISAIQRLGVQFSCSRAVIQSSQYEELEAALGQMTGGHAVVSGTTTLAHVAALPVLIGPRDTVILDQQAHASLHTACGLLRVPLHVIRHSRMDQLEDRLRELSAKHERVWYVFDGLYSMLGDLAPIDALNALLERYPSLHLYVDDAHGTSWLGTHGRGHALQHLKDRSRVVGVLSLNKAFSAGGGALILPNETLARRVRRAGGPLVFAGPLQPPLLAAAIASAKLHLGPELPILQRALQERIQLTIDLAQRHYVPLMDASVSPIFFIRCRSTSKTFDMMKGLRDRHGIYTCPSFFPVVPQRQAGVRITISLHNTFEDIAELVQALASEVQRLDLDEGSGKRLAVAEAPVKLQEAAGAESSR